MISPQQQQAGLQQLLQQEQPHLGQQRVQQPQPQPLQQQWQQQPNQRRQANQVPLFLFSCQDCCVTGNTIHNAKHFKGSRDQRVIHGQSHS